MNRARTANRELWSTGPKSVIMTTRYPLDHPGGVESVARALTNYLGKSEEGWKVSHVAAYSGRVGLARIPLFGDLVAAGRLAAQVIGKGDVLLVHGAEYTWGPLMVGRLTGRPVVAVWHGVRSGEAIPITKRRIRRAARGLFFWSQGLLQGVALQADATVAVSPAVAVQLQARYGFQGEIKVIPNGVAMKTDDRHSEPQRSGSSNADPLRVIWVGTSGYPKGLDLAVQACEIARGQGQNISLTVVGLPIKSVGRDSASAGGWLTGPGFVPPGEMEALYRCHDVLLFPSRYEACPMVVLEALALGLPVIGSSVVQWLIEGAGEVVFGEDVGAYAEALTALADPEHRRRLTAAALKRAQAFSWESSTAGYLEVLNAVNRREIHRYRHRAKQRDFSRSGAE